jgi:hypothetical protein
MQKLLIIFFYLISLQAYAECDSQLPQFAYRHKAKIVIINGKKNLSIRIENVSRLAFEMRPIILINGLQVFDDLKFEKIDCKGIKKYEIPMKVTDFDIIHVFYQKNFVLDAKSIEIVKNYPQKPSEFLLESLIGIDLDVIHTKKKKNITQNIKPIIKLKTINRFNGSSFVDEKNFEKLKTYIKTNKNSIDLKIKFGIPKSLSGKYFLTCFLNGKQVKVFQNNVIGQIFLKENTSIITNINISSLNSGINHLKCLSVNGLNFPEYFGYENLNPNEISSIYIFYENK